MDRFALATFTMDLSTFSLDGEHALITGGGSGLGLGIARCMVAAGAQVTLVGRREAQLREAVRELGKQARFAAHDITRLNETAELAKKVERQAKIPVSILVNNAGIHLKKPVEEITDDEFEAVMRTHVFAAHALNRAVLPGMLARHSGSIILIASMASLFGVPFVTAYSAAKSAYLGMVRTMASEVSGRGVRVNAIAPGWIESPKMRAILTSDPARERRILDRTPAGRFGSPADVGWAAVYLCSPAAAFVTGTVLPVDGGASIGF